MAIIAIISSDHIYFSYMIFLLQLNRPISDKGRGAHKQDGRMAVVWHRQEEKEEVSKAGNSTSKINFWVIFLCTVTYSQVGLQQVTFPSKQISNF